MSLQSSAFSISRSLCHRSTAHLPTYDRWLLHHERRSYPHRFTKGVQRGCRICARDKGTDLTEELKRDLDVDDKPADRRKEVFAPKKRRKTETTDWISSTLTRRFGLAGGLAWAGFLAFGVISEQIKTRLEGKSESEGTKDVSGATEVTTETGLRYTEVRKGGGAKPRKGYLVVLDLRVTDPEGKILLDTRETGKQIVATYGGRPFTGGLCQGVEEALSHMQGGGIVEANIPAALAFGSNGATLQPTRHIPDKRGNVPPNTDLQYRIELLRVSIPPS
ncbi:hypothetical protein WJX73_006385 [Symbiochloris irregularis]|uniref:peptidylprolyl isomerase n=1 Tax=Symbiochloris irregularis TaxID=706552 RepID=A0AAW1NT89_9CHLO